MFKYKAIITAKGEVFLRRLSFYLKKGSIKLHIITGDDSPEYHTHPWDFKSFILFGGYREFSNFKPIQLGKWVSVEHVREYRTGDINIKLHNETHRVELFTLWGWKIPCITIGFYSEKLQLCSFCKELGYCKANKK